MDQNQTLEDLLEDIAWEDWPAAQQKYDVLRRWVDAGGFEPAWLTVIREFITNDREFTGGKVEEP